MTTTLAFLQNQWFRNPEKVKLILSRRDEKFRRLWIKRTLFAGCLTGQRILRAFGDNVDNIVWEETSREIRGHASSRFTADDKHIREAIDLYKPVVILLFGKIAQEAVIPIVFPNISFINGPHPAARYKEVPQELSYMFSQWQRELNYQQHSATIAHDKL